MQKENLENCSSITCGCHVSTFSTTKECPACGRRLRLVGRSERVEFRLTCPDCGYQSSLLSQEELHELL